MAATSSRPDLLTSHRPRGLGVGPIAAASGRPDRPTPIGLVAFRTHRGEPAEAVLGAAGAWDCPRLPVLNRVLNALFAPDRADAGRASFGHGELARVAAWIKGEARPARDPG